MKKLEIRVTDYSKLLDDEFLTRIKEIGVDVISFGNEGCYLHLPDIDTVETIMRKTDEFERKAIIPVAFESHFDKVCRYVDQVAEKVNAIVVNDYGTLRHIQDTHADLNLNISLGTGISFSYEFTPWYAHIFEPESSQIADSFLRSNMDNEWMYSFFERHTNNNFEIEIPVLPHILNSSDNLKEKGYRIGILLNGVLITIARACPTARYFKMMAGACREVCLKKIDVAFTHRWDFFKSDIIEIQPRVREMIPDMKVFGNSMYMKNSETSLESARQKADTLIYDTRFYESTDMMITMIEEQFAGV